MQGNFKAIFSGAKRDIIRLTDLVEKKYSDIMLMAEYSDDFDELGADDTTKILYECSGYINNFTSDIYVEICSAIPELGMEAYIGWECDGDPMNKYLSEMGSADVKEIEGMCCADCGEFIDIDNIEYFNEWDSPICEKCAMSSEYDEEDDFDEDYEED